MRAAFPRKICFGRVAQKKPYGKSLHAVSPCRDLRFVSKPLQLPLKLVRNVAETDFDKKEILKSRIAHSNFEP